MPKSIKCSFFITICISIFVCSTKDSKAQTDTNAVQKFNLHFQANYIYQYKPAFHSPYQGPNSLIGAAENQNSITSTLYLGLKLWKGCDLFINPEVAGGSGLSGAFGLAGSTNGETFRVGTPGLALYLARAYLQQTIALDSGKTKTDDGQNQLGDYMPKNYIQLLAGKFGLADFFDNNVYSNSARTQFLNWTLMNNGAWDYAADVRGYTYSFTAILHKGSMTYRAAVAALPVVANGPVLNTDFGKQRALNVEIDKAYKIKSRDGNLRLLAYNNIADMGNYGLALQNSKIGTAPDVVSTRQNGRQKFGVSINADQQISDVAGVFLRAGWQDGKNETWAYTEADQSASLGIAINGKKWKRPDDNMGFAMVANGLSKDHANYLGAGGLGFELGDGKLNYGFEEIAEFYYNYKPISAGIWFTADYQFIVNPGFNKDRGPVNVFSFRAHFEI